MTRIIVDSTCDMPADLLERFSIAVLRLSVIIDGTPYLDGVDIQLDDVYRAILEGKTPKTSQIQREAANELFTSIAKAGDDWIYLAFSASMSGTFNLANVVCASLRKEYPARRMEVIDSKGGSMGTGLIAIQLGMMNEQGASFDELLSQGTWMADHVKYAFTINNLKFAVGGGRVLARAAGSIGDILSIKPLMDVKNGMLHIVKFVRGSRKSLEAVADFVFHYAPGVSMPDHRCDARGPIRTGPPRSNRFLSRACRSVPLFANRSAAFSVRTWASAASAYFTLTGVRPFIIRCSRYDKILPCGLRIKHR